MLPEYLAHLISGPLLIGQMLLLAIASTERVLAKCGLWLAIFEMNDMINGIVSLETHKLELLRGGKEGWDGKLYSDGLIGNDLHGGGW